MKLSAALILAALTAAPGLLAQDADVRFEVASVRPYGALPRGARAGGPVASGPERLLYERTLFRRLVMDAYGVERDQIKGPAWATADAIDGGALFDVSAKVPEGATKQQLAVMLQNLLKDRFKLSMHRETAASDAFVLVVARGGARLKESVGPVAASERATAVRGVADLKADRNGFPELMPPDRNVGGTFTNGTARMRFRDYPLADLVQQLSFALGLRVIDKTGLFGKYDFTLEFTPPEEARMVGLLAVMGLNPGQTAPLRPGGQRPEQVESVPVVSSAMERQLGLKLEASTIRVETIVIDSAERTPTDN
jgi:uncharacterized protein (TIGR03435 family)